MKQLRTFIKPELGKILAAAIIGGLSSSMAVGLLACSAWLISMASMEPPILVLEVAIVAVRFFGLGRGVLRYSARLIEHNSALRTLSRIRIGIYHRIESQLPSYFSQLRRGELLRHLVADSELLQDLWLRIANPWIGAVISGVAGLGIIFALLPRLALILSAIFVFAIFIIPVSAVLLSANENQRSEESKVFDAIIQASDSVQESLIFGYQDQLKKSIAQAQSKLNWIDLKSGIASGVSTAMHIALTGMSVIIAARYSIPAFADKSLAGVNVAVVVLLPLVIFDGLTGLPAAFSRLPTVQNSATGVDKILSQKSDEPISSVPISGAYFTINFSRVVPKLPEVDLVPYSGMAKPGLPLIISGKSGAGKSSLVHALIGFLEYSGEILINEIPARALSSSDRIEHCAILLQQDHLFATSIRENLRIGSPDATDEELFAVLAKVELAELVRGIGLDTHIGPYGHNFSGGEKQRIKLARTLLRDRPIMILDEPFEYLDLEQASRIARSVADYCRDKTLIVVSHLPVDLW